MHDTTLVATLAGAFVSALALGFLAARLKLPPLVGYLVAGILIGPHTPGFVGDLDLASQLAEIGVILLMFGVGLHFSLRDLMAVRRIAIPGAIVQIATASLIGAVLAHTWGWGWAAGLTFGLALSVASTVVLLRALEQQQALESPEGRIAVGWLIVEDLATVLALVLLPAFATHPDAVNPGAAHAIAADASLGTVLTITAAKVAAFVAIMLVLGRRVVPWLLSQIASTGSRELFTLGVLALALGIAAGSAALFGVSFALGAFFAGVVLAESDLSQAAAEDSLPLQDAFAVLFFVSVGMLFDPAVLLRDPLAVLAVLAVIVLGKSLAALAIVLAFRYPLGTALVVAASLAQIGEFSFILVGLAITLGMLPEAARDLILAGALLSITLNPPLFAAVRRVEAWLLRRSGRTPAEASTRLAPPPLPPLERHAIVVGHGRVGEVITPVLAREGLPFVVVEREKTRYEAAIAAGLPALHGDAAIPGVLESARVRSAALLVLATPDSFLSRRVLKLARAANPHIDVVIRTHSAEHLATLREQQVGAVVMGERELGRTMLHHALRMLGVPPDRARWLVEDPEDEAVAAAGDRR